MIIYCISNFYLIKLDSPKKVCKHEVTALAVTCLHTNTIKDTIIMSKSKRESNLSFLSLSAKIDLVKALADRRILANVHSVSRSGMSRKLKFVIAVPDEKTRAIRFVRVTHNIARIVGCRYNTDDTLTISGCGMDMIFAVIYDLCYRLANDSEVVAELAQEWGCDENEAQAKIIEAHKYSVPSM